MPYYQVEPDEAWCDHCGEWKQCTIWVEDAKDGDHITICEDCYADLPRWVKEKLNG